MQVLTGIQFCPLDISVQNTQVSDRIVTCSEGIQFESIRYLFDFPPLAVPRYPVHVSASFLQPPTTGCSAFCQGCFAKGLQRQKSQETPDKARMWNSTPAGSIGFGWQMLTVSTVWQSEMNAQFLNVSEYQGSALYLMLLFFLHREPWLRDARRMWQGSSQRQLVAEPWRPRIITSCLSWWIRWPQILPTPATWWRCERPQVFAFGSSAITARVHTKHSKLTTSLRSWLRWRQGLLWAFCHHFRQASCADSTLDSKRVFTNCEISVNPLFVARSFQGTPPCRCKSCFPALGSMADAPVMPLSASHPNATALRCKLALAVRQTEEMKRFGNSTISNPWWSWCVQQENLLVKHG